MLGNEDAIATIAVKNLERARRFYEETLGLKPVAIEGDELIVFRSEDSTLKASKTGAYTCNTR
jgi:catechol 2,3-dioxygenase-like lactoylglutathione lyase family enzyme